MAGLKLIQTNGDWAAYTREFEVENKIVGQVNWGAGPQLFPCLVASLPNGIGRVASCYVYPDQAEALVHASRMQHGPVQPAVSPVQDVAGAKVLTVADVNALIRQQTNRAVQHIFREMAANVRAIVEELVEVKITNPDRYESLVAKHLADVDQYIEGKHDRKSNTAPDRVTRRMFPEDDCGGA